MLWSGEMLSPDTLSGQSFSSPHSAKNKKQRFYNKGWGGKTKKIGFTLQPSWFLRQKNRAIGGNLL
jgi:hypothetical protein